jgi:hypothetical protein
MRRILRQFGHRNGIPVSDQISSPPHWGGGIVLLCTVFEAAAERVRLEALGYVVTDVPLPSEDAKTLPADSVGEG